MSGHRWADIIAGYYPRGSQSQSATINQTRFHCGAGIVARDNVRQPFFSSLTSSSTFFVLTPCYPVNNAAFVSWPPLSSSPPSPPPSYHQSAKKYSQKLGYWSWTWFISFQAAQFVPLNKCRDEYIVFLSWPCRGKSIINFRANMLSELSPLGIFVYKLCRRWLYFLARVTLSVITVVSVSRPSVTRGCNLIKLNSWTIFDPELVALWVIWWLMREMKHKLCSGNVVLNIDNCKVKWWFFRILRMSEFHELLSYLVRGPGQGGRISSVQLRGDVRTSSEAHPIYQSRPIV